MLSKRGLPDTEHFFKKTYLNVRTRLGFGSGLPSTLLLLKLAMPSCFHNKKIYVFFSLFFLILWELLLVLSKSALMSLSKGSPVIPQCSREG